MSNTKHTPGKIRFVSHPLKRSNHLPGFKADIMVGDSDFALIFGLTKPEAKANAERIVRCWNSHDELFDIAKSMLPMYELIAKYMPQYYSAVEHENIKAAIKKATE